ncbi:hypothetical protein evm_000404 [Chilo suppressalis]|nr:hypothetical protein evm_000404 [Chilo suppressalis]
MVVILYQTVFSMALSWLTLSCKFQPCDTELYEFSLMKLLYLYDPVACGRVYFYNYTKVDPDHSNAIVWPKKNHVAAGFRLKTKVWLSLHVIWSVLGTIYVFQGPRRPCVLYLSLVSFTCVGIAVLAMDVAFTALFLMDINLTNTEAKILKYIDGINSDLGVLFTAPSLSRLMYPDARMLKPTSDTSWIPLLMAYISCRAIVQWVMNFWLVKDNYFVGLDYYRRIIKKNATKHEQESLEIYY